MRSIIIFLLIGFIWCLLVSITCSDPRFSEFQCHCYVCDSVAPCEHWGNGGCCIDHCHAFEKDAFWGALRQCAKASDKSLAFVSNVGLTPTNQVLSLSNAKPWMYYEESPANKFCFITRTGTPYSVLEHGCHPSINFNPYLVQYHLQNQSVGHIGKQVMSEGGLTPADQVLWLPNNNPLMHNEKPPAGKLCSVTNIGAPFDPQVPGFPRRDKSQAYVYRYHRQKQSAGRSGTEFVPERGLTPANEVISLPNYNPLMHNEETPASGLYSATSVGSPYGAQISGCHPQRRSVDPAGTQLVPEGDSTLTNLQLWLSNNPLMHNEEPPESQFGFIPGTGTPFGAQEPGCHPGNNIGYELQRKKVGRADSQLIHEHVSSFKRPRTSGGASSNTGYHNSSSRNNYGYQFSADPMMSTKSDGVTANSVANTSPWSSMGIGMENYAPSGIRNANPVAPQIHTGSIFNSLAMTAPGVATQPRPERPFKNPVYWELEPLSPTSIYETVMPSIMEQEQKQKQKQNQKLP